MLSCRDLAEVMAERGLAVAYTTILRWVQRFATAAIVWLVRQVFLKKQTKR
jgi:transposase-like protein